MLLDELNSLFEVCETGSLRTVMSGRDKFINAVFVLFEERVDVLLIQNLGTLCLW
jgi:hypothetical protein